MSNYQTYWEQLKELFVAYAPKFLGAIFVLIVGLLIIKALRKFLARIFEKRGLDATLRGFVISMTDILLQTLLWISVLGMIGIQMTSFIAVLGAIGLAIGMALTGTLQNFASGVMILLFKPFKVGDFIETQGIQGTVSSIQIFNTILKTPDNKTIIVPNSNLSNTVLTNYSTEPTRRVDWTFGIGYGDDIDKAEQILRELIAADTRILKEPEPFIAISELADSSVNFTVRVWVKTTDYWAVYFDMNKKVYLRFTQEGINIPYPQMDVHLHQA